MTKQFSIKDEKSWKTPFFTIWGGQGFSILGSQLVQFALIWYLTVTTGSVKVLAIASLIGILPNVILGPFAGTLVDRWNRRWIMLISDSIIAIATVNLAFLFAINSVDIWSIYATMLVRSLAGIFHTNAMSASTSLMVPVEHLTRIQGLNQMLVGGLNILSAPLGALLLEFLPMQHILAIDVITAIFGILPLVFFQIPQPEQTEEFNSTRATVWQDFNAGLQYIRQWSGLLMIGIMTIIINFTIVPAFSMLPLLIKNHFNGGALQLGWIEASMGIGTIIGGVLLSLWGGFKRKILTTLLGLLGMGAGALVLAAAPSGKLSLAIGGVLLIGLMQPITNGPILALIQSIVEPGMQARVFSLLNSISSSMAPLGLLIAGPATGRFGIQAWFLLSGLSLILMSIGIGFIPAVMNIEEKRSFIYE